MAAKWCILSLWSRYTINVFFSKHPPNHVSGPQVIRKKIPIRIKNVENPSGGGTVIHPDPDLDSPSASDQNPKSALNGVAGGTLNTSHSLQNLSHLADHHENKRLPTAVTIKDRIIVLNVNSNRKSVSHGFLAGIFGTLDRFGVVVDLISTSEVHVSMAIEDGLAKKFLDRLIRELEKSGSVSGHFPYL